MLLLNEGPTRSHNTDLVPLAHSGPARIAWVGTIPLWEMSHDLRFTRVRPDGPCALPSACTWSLSPVNLFSHIPWPITGPGSCGLARWAEIVFLCTRLAKIPLITLTAVSRTPASNPMFAEKCSRMVFFFAADVATIPYASWLVLPATRQRL